MLCALILMADISGAYCSLADIEGLTRPRRGSYSDTSVPTKAQVETFAKDIATIMNQKFRANGIKVPLVGEEMLYTARILNKYGAAYIIEMVLHQTQEPPAGSAYAEVLREQFNSLMESFLREHRLPDDELSTNEDRVVLPSGSQLWTRIQEIWDSSEEDTTLRTPMFTRDKKW